MIFFNCESCDAKTHVDDTFQSVIGDQLAGNADCICIPCGKKSLGIQIAIESPDFWGDDKEPSSHIILTLGNDQRSQLVEDWNHSWDSFGALADIIPETMRDTIEELIDQETLKL